MTIGIRLAREHDLGAVSRLYVQLAPGPPYPRAVTTERDADIWRSMLTADRLVVAVAEDNDQLVGTACLLWMPSLTDGGSPTAFIENMVVDESHRRRGIGGVLMGDLLRRATQLGCRRVQLLSHRDRGDNAHRFYASVGFAAEAEGFRITLDPD